MRTHRRAPRLQKCPTGIKGFDEITGGGLPRGRPSLICGGPGSGKTLFALEFLVRGARDLDEPGVFVAFEERPIDLAENVASLRFDLEDLQRRKRVFLDYVYVEKSEIEETGEYDLEGLFIRIDQAIKAVGAKRVVLDTVEALFSGLSNAAVLRAELRRLFMWLKTRGVTTVVTGERGEAALTRQGLEEYVSDCVVLLDNRVQSQLTTRRLRVIKYRGSSHGTNEYPFLIDEDGMSVLPVTSVGLDHAVSDERVSTGVPRLDAMLGERGYYRGSSVLISGTAGTGKSSLAAAFADSTCRAGERCLYFAFEESPQQIMRNMRSIGYGLERHVRSGLLSFHASRPTLQGLEQHLVTMRKLVDRFDPRAVILDPVTTLMQAGRVEDVEALLVRMIDFFKERGITTVMTALTRGGEALEATSVNVSSLSDTWLLLRDLETDGERNRGLYLLKSRGMPHSNRIREFRLTDRGIQLADVVETKEVADGPQRKHGRVRPKAKA